MLPPLPSLAPKCAVCGAPSTRQIQGRSGVKLLCAACELQETHTGRWASPLALPAINAPLLIQAGAYSGCPAARVLVADPPWQFGDATPHKGASDHYKTLTIPEIERFPLPPIADDAVLFLWRVGAGNEKGSLAEAAYGVARAWGFTPKSELVWRKKRGCKKCEAHGWHPVQSPGEAIADAVSEIRVWCDECRGRGYKVAMGMGRYVRGCHEVCLIATRGRCFPEDKGVRSIFDGTIGEHSQKPDEFYKLVERLYPQGPYVELFARRRRNGWHCYGDELPPDALASPQQLAELPSLAALPPLT